MADLCNFIRDGSDYPVRVVDSDQHGHFLEALAKRSPSEYGIREGGGSVTGAIGRKGLCQAFQNPARVLESGLTNTKGTRHSHLRIGSQPSRANNLPSCLLSPPKMAVHLPCACSSPSATKRSTAQKAAFVPGHKSGQCEQRGGSGVLGGEDSRNAKRSHPSQSDFHVQRIRHKITQKEVRAGKSCGLDRSCPNRAGRFLVSSRGSPAKRSGDVVAEQVRREKPDGLVEVTFGRPHPDVGRLTSNPPAQQQGQTRLFFPARIVVRINVVELHR